MRFVVLAEASLGDDHGEFEGVVGGMVDGLCVAQGIEASSEATTESLIEAVKEGNEQRVVALLDEGGDVNGEDRVLAFFLSFWLEAILEWFCRMDGMQ